MFGLCGSASLLKFGLRRTDAGKALGRCAPNGQDCLVNAVPNPLRYQPRFGLGVSTAQSPTATAGSRDCLLAGVMGFRALLRLGGVQVQIAASTQIHDCFLPCKPQPVLNMLIGSDSLGCACCSAAIVAPGLRISINTTIRRNLARQSQAITVLQWLSRACNLCSVYLRTVRLYILITQQRNIDVCSGMDRPERPALPDCCAPLLTGSVGVSAGS